MMIDETDPVADQGPLFERGIAVEAMMGRVMIFALDVCPQASIERFKTAVIDLAQSR